MKIRSIKTNIYKRKLKGGVYSWIVRWKDDATGRWRYLNGGRSKDEALIIEARARESLLKGVSPTAVIPNQNISFSFKLGVKDFLKSARYLSGSTSHRKEVERITISDLIPYFDDRNVSEITKKDILDFYSKLKANGLASGSIYKKHYALCLIFDHFCEMVPTITNPCRKIEKFHKLFPRTAPTRDINFLTPEELDKIISELKRSQSKVAYPFVSLLAYTGMRRSEAFNLKWTDLDFENEFIHIRWSKTKKSRSIPMEPGAKAVLNDIPRASEFVFGFSKTGNRPYKDSFLKPLQRAATRAGISKRVDLHTLRHSYGSNKIRMGWGIKKVSIILGHSDIKTTADIYTHLLDGDLRVRDGFYFDKKLESEKIKELGQLQSVSDLALALSDRLKQVSADQRREWIVEATTKTLNRFQEQFGDFGTLFTES